MTRPRDDLALPLLPRLDASGGYVFVVAGVDGVGAVREDPSDCVFARACRRAGLYDPVVYGTITLVGGRATAADIAAHEGLNGKGSAGDVRPGEEVAFRRVNGARLQGAIRAYDLGGEFMRGEYALLAPSPGNRLRRDRASGDRLARADARREKREPTHRSNPARLVRVATANRRALGG